MRRNMQLLDNAVEAAAQTDTKRVVTLSAKKAGNFYYICISNPTLNDIDGSADISTSKPESSGYGLGLKSVRKAIEKCGGTLELSCKETSSSYTFMAEVILSTKTSVIDTVSASPLSASKASKHDGKGYEFYTNVTIPNAHSFIRAIFAFNPLSDLKF